MARDRSCRRTSALSPALGIRVENPRVQAGHALHTLPTLFRRRVGNTRGNHRQVLATDERGLSLGVPENSVPCRERVAYAPEDRGRLLRRHRWTGLPVCSMSNLAHRPTWALGRPRKMLRSRCRFREAHPRARAGRTSRRDEARVARHPSSLSVHKYAKLTLSAHLTTPYYELADGAFLYEKMSLMPVADKFELKGPPAEITIDEASTEGKTGDEVAVCSCLFPTPFGTWQSDYFGMGLRIPAPYTVTNTEIRCTHESIDCIASDGKVASRTRDMERQLGAAAPKGRFDALRYRDHDRSGGARRSNGTARAQARLLYTAAHLGPREGVWGLLRIETHFLFA